MTSGSPPQRKARETNFTDIGVAGRRTGFTVKDTGRRDSYGMESMDGFFSPPPQPAPVQNNMLRDIPSSAADSQPASGAHNGTISIEESMDIANSSVVEPAAALSARRLASLPPRARSPIKTNLKSPARRASTIDFSSPEKGQEPPLNRRLQFGGSSSSGEPSSISQFSKPAQRLSMSPMRGGGATGGNASSSSREGKLPADRSKGKGKQVLPQVAEEEKPDNKPVPPAATKPKRGLLTQKRAQPAPKAFVLEASSDASDGDEDIAMGGTDQVWEEPINTDAFDGDFGIVPEDDDSVIAEEESEVLPAAKKGKQVEGREPAKQKLAPSTKQAKVPPPEKAKPQPKAKANGIGKGKGKAQEDESSPPPKARSAAGGQSKATRKTGKPLLHVDESKNDGGDLEEEPSPAQKPKPPVKGKARAVRKTGKPYVPSDEGERDDEELEGEPTPAQKPKPPVKGKAGGMRKTGKPHVPSDEGESDDGESEEEEPIPAPKAKAPVRAKGRSKGKLVAEASEEQREEVKKSSQAPKPKAIPKGRAKAKATEAEVEKEPEPSQQANKKPPPKGRGRAQPKASKAPEPEIPESDRDEQTVAEESEPEVEQPARKRPRKSPKEVASPLPAKASAKSKGKAPAVSKATKKQVAAVRREYSPELQSHVPSPVVRRPAAAKGAPSSSSSSSRPSQSQKQGKGGQRVIREKPEPTAPEPTAAEGRRSSRQRIKPLEFWKGEKVVYTLGERRKSGAPNAIKMPEIAEIIRVESDQEEKERERERRRKKSASAGAKRKRPVKEEESDYEEEDWETRVVDGEVGVVRGYVKTYPSPQIPGQEMLEEVELAFSRNRIVTVEVAHSAFTFVKTYTQPYFGTGIIEIPPGGIKKTKNSGKMQLVFYLLAGKVQVQIGETSFRIRKGSQFMVPRGNLYSIENPYDHQARMFFAQGCEVDPQDDE